MDVRREAHLSCMRLRIQKTEKYGIAVEKQEHFAMTVQRL